MPRAPTGPPPPTGHGLAGCIWSRGGSARSMGQPLGPTRGRGRAPWGKSRNQTSLGLRPIGTDDIVELIYPNMSQRAGRACTSAPSK
eukprot:873479-Pyramimonas_sp.AAC.1